MPVVRFTRRTPLPAAPAWRRLTDWERHADGVPFTRITVGTPRPAGVGTRFTARTSLAGVGFDDPMDVVEWRPPAGGRAGRCRLAKRGRVVTGWAVIEVRPLAAGCEVAWHEELAVRGVPRLLDPVTAGCARLLFGRVVDSLLTAE